LLLFRFGYGKLQVLPEIIFHKRRFYIFQIQVKATKVLVVEINKSNFFKPSCTMKWKRY